MRRRSKPADRLANIFKLLVFAVIAAETAALIYMLTRPKPDARSEFLVEPGKHHSLLIDDERFPIAARPGQKIVVMVENSKTPPPPLPEQRTIIPQTEEQQKSSLPKEPRFRLYYDSPEELKWLRLTEKLDNLRGVDDWNTIINVMKWARSQFEPGTPKNYPTQNAIKLLPLLRSGEEEGFCAQYCYITVQALQSLGFIARYVTIANHEVAEVWVPSHHRWVAIDPMNSVHFEDTKGRKLSALDVYRKRSEARAVPASNAPTAQPSTYRYLAYWLRNDLYTKPLNIYDLNRWRVRAVLNPSDLAQISSGDLYTYYPEEFYAPPTKNN